MHNYLLFSRKRSQQLLKQGPWWFWYPRCSPVSRQFILERFSIFLTGTNSLLRTKFSKNFQNKKTFSYQKNFGSCYWSKCCHGSISAVDDSICKKFISSILEYGYCRRNWKTFKIGGKFEFLNFFFIIFFKILFLIRCQTTLFGFASFT